MRVLLSAFRSIEFKIGPPTPHPFFPFSSLSLSPPPRRLVLKKLRGHPLFSLSSLSPRPSGILLPNLAARGKNLTMANFPRAVNSPRLFRI